jgi:hypothetical protein
VYVALKFEGEGYFPERKGERNRVALDRVVLVSTGVKPASAEKRKEKSK